MNSKPLPRAGLAPRLTRTPFESAASSLLDMGFEPLPIDPNGKRPAQWGGDFVKGIRRWQSLSICEGQINAWMRDQRHANFGIGVRHSETFVGLDLDTADPELIAKMVKYPDKLNGAAVHRVGRKGFCAYFRAEAGILGRKLSSAGHVVEFPHQSVIPPSIHPDTGRPYIWITPDTLEDTPMGALPLLTVDDVEALDAILHEHTGEPVTRQQSRPGVTMGWPGKSRDWIAEAAMAKLSAWVPALGLYRLTNKAGGYCAVATWRASGEGRPLEKRKLNLHIDGKGIKDFGTDRSYSPVSLVMAAQGLDFDAARDWLLERLPVDPSLINGDGAVTDKDGEPWPSAKLRAERLAALNDNGRRRQRVPAYVSIAEGQRQMRQEIESFVADAIRAEDRGAMPVKVIAAEAGLGKTHVTVEAVVDACRQGLSVCYAVPEHFLAMEIFAKLQAADPYLDVRVWNGFERKGMCQRAQEAKALVNCGIGIQKLCTGTKDDDGQFSVENACPFYSECAYQRQREARPQVWIVAHAALFLPSALKFASESGRPDLLIVDETFATDSWVIGGPVAMTGNFRHLPGRREIDEDGRAVKSAAPRDVAETWATILQALADHIPVEDAPINMYRRFAGNCNVFLAAGLTVERVRTLTHYLNHQMAVMRDLLDMGNVVRGARYLRMQQRALQRYFNVATGVRRCMADEVMDSGRIWTHCLHGGAKAVRTGKQRCIQPFWHEDATVLLLDATPPPVTLLAAVLPAREIEPPNEIAVDRSKDVRVVQVIGAPFQKSKIINRKTGKQGDKFPLMDQASRDIAAAVGGPTLIVPRAPMLEFVNDGQGYAYESPGKVVGRNDWASWPGLVVTASTELSLFDVESAIGVITGHMPPHDEPPAIKGKRHDLAPTEYERVLCSTRQSAIYEASRKRALDDDVTELDRHLTDRTYVQVAARLRGIWRDGQPGLIVIFADCDLPFRADEAMSWDAFRKKGVATDWMKTQDVTTVSSLEKIPSYISRDDSVVTSFENHVIIASSELAFLADPGAFTSLRACQKHYRLNSAGCPDGWVSTSVKPERSTSWGVVFHDPAVVTVQALPAVVAQMTGRPCRLR